MTCSQLANVTILQSSRISSRILENLLRRSRQPVGKQNTFLQDLSDLGMQVMPEPNAHNFPLDLA